MYLGLHSKMLQTYAPYTYAGFWPVPRPRIPMILQPLHISLLLNKLHLLLKKTPQVLSF